MRKKFKVTYGKPSTSKTQMKNLKRKDVYVTYDGITKSPYSKQKFGEIGEIKMKNGSTISVKTGEEWQKVTGKHFYDPPLWTDEAIIKAIDNVKYWVIRAWVCVKLGDYESALNRIERALTAFDLIKVAQVYGVNVD